MPSGLRWSFALLGTLGCATAPADIAPRPLLGVVDTVLAVGMGSPFGAAVSREGLALVTLHGQAAALASWDFRTREFRPEAYPTGREPTNVAFSPDGRTAYVASQFSYRVDRIDLVRDQVDSAWHTPANDPFQVAASPDGRLVFATGNAGYLYGFDPRSGAAAGAVQTRGAPNGLVVSSAGDRVFLTHLRSREIGVVEFKTGRYGPLAQMDAEEGQGIVLSPDGETLYALSEAAATLYAFDIASGRRLATRSTGAGPFGLAMTPDGAELWVTTLNGLLIRYRRTDLSEIQRLPLGGRLRRVAMDPRGRGAVVADEAGRILVLR